MINTPPAKGLPTSVESPKAIKAPSGDQSSERFWTELGELTQAKCDLPGVGAVAVHQEDGSARAVASGRKAITPFWETEGKLAPEDGVGLQVETVVRRQVISVGRIGIEGQELTARGATKESPRILSS